MNNRTGAAIVLAGLSTVLSSSAVAQMSTPPISGGSSLPPGVIGSMDIGRVIRNAQPNLDIVEASAARVSSSQNVGL